MNICMFTNTYLPHIGGVARSVGNFTRDIREMGHKVLVVAPTFPDRKPGEDADHVLRVPAIQNFNGSDFSVRIPLPFIINERIDEFRPDIIHSHHPFLLGDAAMRAAYRRDVPLVFTHHTLYEEYTHYVSNNSSVMKRFIIKLSTLYANLCQHVVAPSESIADLLEDRGVKRPISVIPTGVDVEFFRKGEGSRFRRSFGIPGDARIIGHLGRLAPEKNLAYLAEAAASAMKKDGKAWFLVAGSGTSRKRIEEILYNAGVSDRLVMAGSLTGDNLRDAYNAMDVFVFASKSETQGMVLAEAMAAGIPVIALDAPGVREVVKDGINGRLLPDSSDPAEFAETLVSYFSSSAEKNSWSRAARETADMFSRRNSAAKMAELYGRISEQGFLRPEGSLMETIIPWESLQRTIKAEWDLLSQKATAVVKTVQPSAGGAVNKQHPAS